MNKNTTLKDDELIFRAWLLAGSDGSLSLTRMQPSAGLGEVAISLSLTVPRVLYRRPALRAVITLPEVPSMDPETAVAVLTEAVEKGCDFAVSVSVDAETVAAHPGTTEAGNEE